MLLYLYQIFIFLLGHLHFFLHLFFSFMENFFKKHPISHPRPSSRLYFLIDYGCACEWLNVCVFMYMQGFLTPCPWHAYLLPGSLNLLPPCQAPCQVGTLTFFEKNWFFMFSFFLPSFFPYLNSFLFFPLTLFFLLLFPFSV